MTTYKYKDINTSVDKDKTIIEDNGTAFYTEDKGTTALRLFIKWRDQPFNLDNTTMKPVLDLFHSDGSIWRNEPLEVINTESGLVQYKLPNNVIAHAGNVRAKLFLKNTDESVHIANFDFIIKDSGIEGTVAKEISVNIVDDAVRRIVKENAIEILGDGFEQRLNIDVINHLDSNPELFKGDDGISAYEVAVRYGYLGTEQEWLESLKMDNNEVINARGDRENLNERITYIESNVDRANKNYSSIEEYGGKITDSFDNSSIVNNLVSAEEDIYIKLPKGNIKMSNIILPSNKNIIIEGSGEGITNIETTGQFLKTYNPVVFSTEVSSDTTLSEGETEIPLLNNGNVQIGQMVTLTSNEKMEETSRSVKKCHTAIITDVKDNTITLDRGLPSKFTLNITKDYVISVKGYKVGKIKISNLTVSGEYNGFFIDLHQTYNLEIDSVTIKNKNKGYQGLISGGSITTDGGEMKAIRAMSCVDLKVVKCSFEYISYGVMPTGGTSSVLVENCTALRCRHVCAPTGGSQNVTVSNCNAYHCFAGFDSHQTAYDTKHINCSSYNDEISSKFRGRIDHIAMCNFGGGIELTHDLGLVNTKEYRKFTKQVSGGTIVQKKLYAAAINVTIRDVYVSGILNTFSIHNSLIISDTIVKLDSFEGLGNDTLGKAIDYMLLLSFAKSTSITNVNLIGPFEDEDRSDSDVQGLPFSAIKIDRNNNKGFVKLEGIAINGFEYGIYLPTSLDMNNFKLSNINIDSCVTGIYNEPNYKDNLSMENIYFKNNKINILEPFRFRYKNRPNNPLKGQEYYDEGIKKKIIYDGSNWIDFNGTIV